MVEHYLWLKIPIKCNLRDPRRSRVLSYLQCHNVRNSLKNVKVLYSRNTHVCSLWKCLWLRLFSKCDTIVLLLWTLHAKYSNKNCFQKLKKKRISAFVYLSWNNQIHLFFKIQLNINCFRVVDILSVKPMHGYFY